jgi:hypothetical protein
MLVACSLLGKLKGPFGRSGKWLAGNKFVNFMITINRSEHDGLAWKKEVANALKQGSNVTLTNFVYDSDMNHCEEIGKKHKAKVSLHLDYTVCCFTVSGKRKR